MSTTMHQDNNEITEIDNQQMVDDDTVFPEINAVDKKGVVADEPSQDYGYEDYYTHEPSASSRSNRQAKRRNVVKADANVYDLSYHPGRVVSLRRQDGFC
eukprot:scaffold9519_cov183-Amphora_coffeaeformis.AAC.4